MHGWDSAMKREYKQKGGGMVENRQEYDVGRGMTTLNEHNQQLNCLAGGMDDERNEVLSEIDDVVDDTEDETHMDDDSANGTENETDMEDDDDDTEDETEDDEMEEQDDETEDDDDGTNDETEEEDDDYCSEEEDGGIWHDFRKEITQPYADDFRNELNKFKEMYPEAPVNALREGLIEVYKESWIDDAAMYLKRIITYYEKFQDNSQFFEKIMRMKDKLEKKEKPEEALDMAINVYKYKLGSLFSCNGFDIPK